MLRYFHELYTKIIDESYPKFNTVEEARLDAIKTMKRNGRRVAPIKSYDDSGPMWETKKEVGTIEVADNGYLWEVWNKDKREDVVVGKIDPKSGKILKGAGVSAKKNRFYTIGTRFHYDGRFMGASVDTEYKTVNAVRKSAYGYVMGEINSKGWPNHGLTCSAMIYGHNVRPNNRYSFELYVFALRTNLVGALKLNGSSADSGPIYELKRDGTLGKIVVQSSTIEDCKKYQAKNQARNNA